MKYLMILFILAGSVILSAHPASKVDMIFDQETSILSIEFTHKVSDGTKHYIEEVTVFLNNEQIIEQLFTQQHDLSSDSLVYKISEAKSGDKLEVTTKCNKFGKKSAEIVIE